MTKEAALFQFFSSFGIDAYPISNVPAGTAFPYLSYVPVTDSWSGDPVSLTVQLWYYTTSETAPNAKAREIAERIGDWIILPLGSGEYIKISKGSPWCNPSTGEGDENVKVRQLNVTAEYLTKF